MTTETKKIRLNVDLLTFKAGQEVRLKFRKGVPVDRFWRRRLQDARIDNCVQVVEETSPVKKVKAKKVNTDDR